MKYLVWQVFSGQESCGVRFYVINMVTKGVQSTWRSYLEAKVTSDTLNRANNAVHNA